MTPPQCTQEMMGCTSAEFQRHIQLKMDKWNTLYAEDMCHDNVHIDHIKPLGAGGDVRELCHYTNLQPLLPHHNSQKRATWSELDEQTWWSTILYACDNTDIYWPSSLGVMHNDFVIWKSLHMLSSVAASVCS